MTANPSTTKRDALIDAAKDLLWERGYEAMSPKAVLRESGAGQGSLYHHFEGKRDLAATALLEIGAQMRESFDAYLNPKLSAYARLEAYLDAPRETLKGCRFGRLANEQAISDPVLNPIVLDFFRYFENRLAATVREAQKDGDLPQTLKAKEIALMLGAVVQGGYVLSRVHQDPALFKQATHGAKSMLRALSAKTA